MPQIEPTSFASPDAHAPRMTRGKLCPRCQTMYTEDAEEGDFCARDGAALVPSNRIFAGKYVLGEQLGFGQTGDVFSATQAGVGRQVALKILRADQVDNPDIVKRFEYEAQIASSIDHPNAVTIFESGRSADGQAFIAMELLTGETLERRLQREGPPPTGPALELLLPIIRAVAAAHGRGVVHRDLKPDNIFIARKQVGGGPDEVVKVLDFGIAGRVTSLGQASAPDTPLGTPLYMAPEQLQDAPATLRSDVFALGMIMTEVLTGRLPWGETAATTSPTATMARLVRSPLSLVELLPEGDFPEALQLLVMKTLARDPQQRPTDAGALLRLLQPIAVTVVGGLHPALISSRHLPLGQVASPPLIDSTATLSGRETKPLPKMPGRKWWLLAASGVVVAALLAMLWHRQPPAPLLGLGQTTTSSDKKSAAKQASSASATVPPTLAAAAVGADSEPPPSGTPTTPLSRTVAAGRASAPAPSPSASHHHHRHREPPALLSTTERPHHHHHRTTTAGLATGETQN